MRKQFRVSTKAAVFDTSHKKVVVIHMDKINAWGLPSGHIEDGETPDEAITHELSEECGLICTDLQKKVSYTQRRKTNLSLKGCRK